MYHRTLVVLLPFLLTVTSLAGQGTAVSKDSIERSLIQLERALAAANLRRDRVFFDRVEADEFVYTGPTGSRTTKAEDLASLDSPSASTLIASDPDSMTVRVYGQTAVVWGRSVFSLRGKDGTTVARQDRFTDVFVWRDDRWQIVAGHASRIPTKQP